MADQHRVPLAETSDQPGHVVGQGEGVVAALGLVAVAVAAQIGRDDPEAGLRQAGI